MARRWGVAANLLYRWRRLDAEGGVIALSADEGVVSVSEVRRLEDRVRVLERLLGRKTMDAEILKEALERSRAKNRPCSVRRRPRTLPGEAHCGDTRCVAVSTPRPFAGGRQAASALSKSAGRGAAASNSPVGGYATDVRLPSHHSPAETRACQRQSTPCQPQPPHISGQPWALREYFISIEVLLHVRSIGDFPNVLI